jgi:hypothetical protein
VSQTHGVTLWVEPKANGAVPSVTPMVLKLVGDRWMFAAGTAADAIPVYRDGAYVITSVSDPLYDPTAPALQFVRVRGRIQSF